MTVKATQLGTFTATGQGYPRVGADGDHTFSLTVVGSGTVTATVAVMASSDLTGWTQIATLVANGSGVAAAVAVVTASYVYWRADVSAITAGAQANAVATTEEAYGTGGGAASLTVTGPPPLTATVGTAYTIDFGAIGGVAPYIFGSTGTLPPGLPAINAATGVSSASPTTAGSYTFSGTVTDALGTAATLGPFTVVVSAASSPDTTAPVMSGSITTSNLTQTSYTMAWPAGTDAVGITAYQTSVDGGSTWVGRGLSLSAAITGRTAGATDQLRVRALDAAANVSNVLSGVVTLTAAGASTKPKFGYGLANPSGDQSAFATIFAGMTDMAAPGASGVGTGSANGSKAGTFQTVSSTTNYTWLAILASAGNPTISDGTGTGNYDGALSSGIYTGLDTTPTTTFGAYTDGSGNVWHMFRSDGKASTLSTWSIS